MNKPAVLFAFTTVACCIGSTYLVLSLRVERDRADALQNRVTQFEDAARIAKARQTGSFSSATTPEESQHPPVPIAPASEPGPPDSRTSDAPGKSRGWDGAEFSRRLPNPTYRAAQFAYLRLEVEEQYPDLAASLNLQPDEAERLLNLLAAQALREREYQMKINDEGQVSDETVAARRRQDEERRRTVEAERAALLGDAKLQEWSQYQNSLGARAQMRELRTMLAESNFPLRDDQVAPLVTALAAEQQRHTAERENLYNSSRNPTDSTPKEVIQHMTLRLDLIEQSLRRRNEAASLYLSSEQQKRYDEMLSRERKRAQIDYDSFVTLNNEQLRDR